MQGETPDRVPISPAVRRPPPIPPGNIGPSELSLVWASPWRDFFSLTGGSILYCLSAMSLIYGIATLLGPILGRPAALHEAFPCIGALNVYEVALLGALLFLVVKEGVTDDAISLVVLVALFLVGTGITLSTLADQGYRAVLLIGMGCFLLALGKFHALRTWVRMRVSGLAFAGLTLLAAWNFAAGALLVRENTINSTARGQWMLSWWVLLAGAGLLVADAHRAGAIERAIADAKRPFLKRSAMHFVFAAILLAAAGVHQYVLGYIFDVSRRWGDYLPLLSLIVLLGLRLSLGVRARSSARDALIALFPLGACGYAILSRGVVASPSQLLELPWHPPLYLALTGAAILAVWRRQPSQALLAVCGAYAAGVLLTVGFTPDRPYDLQWRATGALAVLVLMAVGLVRRNLSLCVLAVLISSVGFSSVAPLMRIFQLANVTVPGALAGMAGVGTLLVAFVFGARATRALGVAAALGTIAGFLDGMTRRPSWPNLAAAVILILLAAVLWLRTRDWPPPVVLLIPVAVWFWALFARLGAWRLVILSFVLLFGGLALRVYRARRDRRAGETVESPGRS